MDVSLSETKWDVIIGSDLVYNDAGVTMLPQVLKVILFIPFICIISECLFRMKTHH